MVINLRSNKFAVMIILTIPTLVNSNEIRHKTSPDLVTRLKGGGTANVFVSFVTGIDTVLSAHRRIQSDSPLNKLEFLRNSLIENMEISQRNINHLLARRMNSSTGFKSFWVTNQMFIENADLPILEEIAEDPKVKNIREEGTVFIIKPDETQESSEKSLKKIPWGITRIQAPEAWSLTDNNFVHEAIIVATIDTGVRHTHEALKTNFLGEEYGWYDPSGSQDTPFDVIGHGTHVTGTIVGGNGIGVAPHAKWATCAMCSKHLECLPRFTLECGQFFVCPTLADGSKPDCSKTPRVISNAWGSSMEEEWTEMIKVWHAAGIIPVFALGNSGPSCGSTFFPGNSTDVIAVGNTDREDNLHPTSSLGPTADGRIKPDIVAPGTDILSAGIKGDDSYHVATGTSMSAPHVAGAIAILLAKQTNLTFQDVKSLLFKSADRETTSFGGDTCQLSHTGNVTFPNNLYGHGRLNVYKALKMIL